MCENNSYQKPFSFILYSFFQRGSKQIWGTASSSCICSRSPREYLRYSAPARQTGDKHGPWCPGSCVTGDATATRARRPRAIIADGRKTETVFSPIFYSQHAAAAVTSA